MKLLLDSSVDAPDRTGESYGRSSAPGPADRFLAATAKVMDLTLVTADAQLAEASDIAVLRN